MATQPTHADVPRNRLDQFLFAPTDARAVAFMRVALAVMIGWAFWSLGLRPTLLLTTHPGIMTCYESVFLTPWYAALVTMCAVVFGLGFRPRLSGLVLIVLLLPLVGLNRGAQSRLVLLCTLLAFSMLRSDAQWSIRTWLGHATPELSAGPMWPIRLMQIQVSIIYGVNVLAKLTPHYLNGDVLIGLSRMRPNFLVDLSDDHLYVGPFAFPGALAAIATVTIEGYLAIAFWFPRLRWPTAMLGVLFHLILQRIVRIFMLDYTSMFLYLAFLLPWQGEAKRKEPTQMKRSPPPPKS